MPAGRAAQPPSGPGTAGARPAAQAPARGDPPRAGGSTALSLRLPQDEPPRGAGRRRGDAGWPCWPGSTSGPHTCPLCVTVGGQGLVRQAPRTCGVRLGTVPPPREPGLLRSEARDPRSVRGGRRGLWKHPASSRARSTPSPWGHTAAVIVVGDASRPPRRGTSASLRGARRSARLSPTQGGPGRAPTSPASPASGPALSPAALSLGRPVQRPRTDWEGRPP